MFPIQLNELCLKIGGSGLYPDELVLFILHLFAGLLHNMGSLHRGLPHGDLRLIVRVLDDAVTHLLRAQQRLPQAVLILAVFLQTFGQYAYLFFQNLILVLEILDGIQYLIDVRIHFLDLIAGKSLAKLRMSQILGHFLFLPRSCRSSVTVPCLQIQSAVFQLVQQAVAHHAYIIGGDDISRICHFLNLTTVGIGHTA